MFYDKIVEKGEVLKRILIVEDKDIRGGKGIP